MVLQYSKEEIVELILNDIEEFKAYRESSPNELLDLTESHFDNCNLSDISFENIDFTGSTFSESEISSVNFVDCDLSSTDFTHANIIDCEFTQSAFVGSDLSYATIDNCEFTDVDFSGVILLSTDLSSSDLSCANNLNASRFDEETLFPDSDMLPENFDSRGHDDLSLLKDNDDINPNQIEY